MVKSLQKVVANSLVPVSDDEIGRLVSPVLYRLTL